jgi:hypothetical protein
MRKYARRWACAAASLLAAAAAAASQHHPERHGHHHLTPAPAYDVSKEATLHCTVHSVDEVVAGDCRGCDGGIHLRATCAGEECDIHLGPSAYVASKSFAIAKDDEIDVTGARVAEEGGVSVIAREVKKGEAVLALRDERGRPLWRRPAR